MKKFLYIAFMILLLAGCSRIQFAYNQLDWLIPYYIESYVELTDSQDTYLEQQVTELLNWHCSSHLGQYAELLHRLNNDFQSGSMTQEKLQAYVDQLDRYWQEIMQHASPALASLFLSASDEQVEELVNGFAEKNKEWLEEFNAKTEEELRAEYEENMVDELERWFGPLQSAQQQAVSDWSRRFKPLGLLGLRMRERWQARLHLLLSQRDEVEAFNAGIVELFANPDALRSEAYLARADYNEKITVEMIYQVSKQLDRQQLENLASMAGSLADDFTQLSCVRQTPRKQLTAK